MSLQTTGAGEATLTGPGLATMSSAEPLGAIPGLLRRASGVAGEAIGVFGLVLCLPFVIVAIGMPIALIVRLVLWMVER